MSHIDQIIDSGIIAESCHIMGIPNSHIPIISPLQAGQFANHILFNYASVDIPKLTSVTSPADFVRKLFVERPKVDHSGFVLCIGKNPSDTPDGKRIANDFTSLVELYSKFPQLVEYTGCTYHAVRPLAAGKVLLDGQEYSMYATQFDPNPELGCDGKVIPSRFYPHEDHDVLPFLFHPTPHSSWEDVSNYKVNMMAWKLIEPFSFGGEQTLRHVFEQILLGNALVAASLGQFPIDFSLNRGDWIGNFNPPADSLKTLTFISTNGVMKPADEKTWGDQMLTYEDLFPLYNQLPVGPDNPMLPMKPFGNSVFNFSKSELNTIFRRAEKLVHDV